MHCLRRISRENSKGKWISDDAMRTRESVHEHPATRHLQIQVSLVRLLLFYCCMKSWLHKQYLMFYCRCQWVDFDNIYKQPCLLTCLNNKTDACISWLLLLLLLLLWLLLLLLWWWIDFVEAISQNIISTKPQRSNLTNRCGR